jgi:hypothetical protein
MSRNEGEQSEDFETLNIVASVDGQEVQAELIDNGRVDLDDVLEEYILGRSDDGYRGDNW